MKLELTVIKRDGEATGELLVSIHSVKPKERQLVFEMEKLLNESSILKNSGEYDTYNGLGISYTTHTGYRANVKKLYNDSKPLAQDAIDRREYE